MSLSSIYTNTDALTAIGSLNKNQNLLSQTLKRLSTGLKINSSVDDPSGISIAAKFRSQISGTEQAISNAQLGVSMLQTADSALSETQDVLLRMRDLAVKAANGAAITTATISNINSELQSLKSELTRKATAVTFNTKALFSGGYAGGMMLQVGPDNSTANTIVVAIRAVTLTSLNFISAGIWGNGTVTGPGSLAISNMPGATLPGGASTAVSVAQVAIDYIQSAINIVSDVRATIGVQERRLNYAINDLSAMDINLTSALSNIQDADMASEITMFARLQVLQQTTTSILAQANVAPSQLVDLLNNSTNK